MVTNGGPVAYLKERLQFALALGLLVFWDDDGKLRQISVIGAHHEEPGLVAYLKDIPGQYIALDNCEPNELVLMTEIKNWFKE